MEQIGNIYGFPVVIDETLPQDCMKLIGGGNVTVFRIDGETTTVVAQWPEGLELLSVN